MKSQNERKSSGRSQPAAHASVPASAPTAKKRFLIEKLEERIAPKKSGRSVISSASSGWSSPGGSIY